MNNRALVMLALALLVLCAIAAGLPATRAAAAPPQQSGSGGSITYTSDGKACVREVHISGLGGGGDGEEPYYALESSGGDDAFVVREIAHPGATFVAYVQPAGQLMITHDIEDKVVRLWEAATGKYKTAMRHPKGLGQVVLAGSRPTVATTDGEGRVWLWDLSKDPIPTPRLMATTDEYWTVTALSPDGRYLALAEEAVLWNNDDTYEGSYGVVRLINTSTGAERRLVGSFVSLAQRDRSGNLTSPATIGYGHGATIDHMAFSSDGQVLLTSSHDGTVRMWRVSTGEHLRCYEIQDGYAFFDFALSPNGREFLSEQDSQITLWNALTGRVVRRFGVPESYQVLLSEYGGGSYGFTHTIGFRPDGAAVYQSFSNEVRIWNTQTGRLQGVIRVEPEDWVASAAYSPDRRHLALARNWDSAEDVLVTVSDHRVTQDAATATRYVEAGLELGLQGDIRGMVNALREAEASDPFRQIRAAKVFAFAARNALAWNNIYVNSSRYDKFLAAIPAAPARLSLDARNWNGLCWFGSLATRSDLFIDYCDKAVAAANASQRAGFRDSRAIARMFSGDRTGAIADLTAFVDHYKTSEPALARLRQSWIDALRNGRDPEDFLNTTALWTE